MKNLLKIVEGFLRSGTDTTLPSQTAKTPPESNVLEVVCPYCESKDFVKRGVRKNKLQTVQLYLCRNAECKRTFTASDIKGKKFPMNIIVAGITIYNLG